MMPRKSTGGHKPYVTRRHPWESAYLVRDPLGRQLCLRFADHRHLRDGVDAVREQLLRLTSLVTHATHVANEYTAET